MILFGFSHRGARWLASVAVAVLIIIPNGQTAWAQDDNPVAAAVNGETITRTEILLAMELLSAQFRVMPPEKLFPLIRGQLIDIKLLAAKGTEAGLRNDPRIVASVNIFAMRHAYDYYARDIVSKYLDDELMQESHQKFLENISRGRRTQTSAISSSPPKRKPRKSWRNWKAAPNLPRLARSYSVGPSAPQGGVLGFLRREQVVAEFAEAAFALEDGGISAPIQTQFGWHVITVSERRVPEPPEFAQVEQKLRAEIADRLVADAAKQEREDAEIELFEMDEDFFASVTVAP